MNFFDNKRSVAGALSMLVTFSVALGLTVPGSLVETNSSMETTTESLEELVDVPITKPVAVSDNLVGTCNNPAIAVNCVVYLAAYGIEDRPIYGYVGTNYGGTTQILTPDEATRNRGVTLFELDATTCLTRNRQRFDTFWSSYDRDRTQLLETLQSAVAGTIIIGVTADSAEHDFGELQSTAGPFFMRYNMDLGGLQVRDKFAFIMQKGYPKKTVFQRRARNTASLVMSVAIGGSTVSDVTFTCS